MREKQGDKGQQVLVPIKGVDLGMDGSMVHSFVVGNEDVLIMVGRKLAFAQGEDENQNQ